MFYIQHFNYFICAMKYYNFEIFGFLAAALIWDWNLFQILPVKVSALLRFLPRKRLPVQSQQ